jgi:hypothetical protein
LEVRLSQDRHIVWVAAAFVLLMIVAFTPTYFQPIATGAFDGPPILHLHGALFFAWPVLFLIQATLAARGNLSAHRSLGLLGIALATSMFFAGIAAVASDLRIGQNGLALVAFSGLATFTLLFVLALVYRKQREYHLRWMFLATLVLMQAVSARLVIRVILRITPPSGTLPMELVQRIGMIHLAFDVLVLAIVCFADWRKRGRPHVAFVLGGALIMFVHAFRHLAVDTTAWRSTADLILALSS